jgi:hypothetical protein
MGKKYTIPNNGAGTQKDSPDLVGCQIEDNGDGTFNFLDSQGNQKGTGTSLPFSINVTNLDGFNWTLFVRSKSPSTMSGNWTNTDGNDVSPTNEGDSWTATATGPEEEDADEARAASAT